MAEPSSMGFDPSHVDLTTANSNTILQITCFLQKSGNEYSGDFGARVSALFVILICSALATFFPVAATRIKWLRINLYVYLFARYFGAGVIVATAFIHLLDPAYQEIGPASCVGMTGGWASYSWPPAIALVSTMIIFLMDFAAERYVEKKYDMPHDEIDVESIVVRGDQEHEHHQHDHHLSHQFLHSGDQREDLGAIATQANRKRSHTEASVSGSNTPNNFIDRNAAAKKVDEEKAAEREVQRSFQTQIAAFLILEFGVIVHSVIIGLNLGTAGPEFSTLYPVLVFHQSFEGLGIGARLSAIAFPKRWSWLPWFLCTAYGLTTPIAIGVGLGIRNTYQSGSFTANVVSGILDSISAGILLYTGLVELLARDFLFDPNRTKKDTRLAFMIFSVFLGCALMALLGKWA